MSTLPGPRPDIRYLLASGLLGFVLGAFLVGSLGTVSTLAPHAAAEATPSEALGRDVTSATPPDTPAATTGRGAAPAPSTDAHSSDASPEPADLAARDLDMPVEGVQRNALVPSFHDARTGHVHEALDILAPRNTPVVAVEDGRIAKLFLSKAGGNTIYQFDPSGAYCYYYAHLERYADGLHEGDEVHRGQVIGYVGTSGNAPKNTPHLHFAIFRLTPEHHWWQGTAIDPYPLLRR